MKEIDRSPDNEEKLKEAALNYLKDYLYENERGDVLLDIDSFVLDLYNYRAEKERKEEDSLPTKDYENWVYYLNIPSELQRWLRNQEHPIVIYCDPRTKEISTLRDSEKLFDEFIEFRVSHRDDNFLPPED